MEDLTTNQKNSESNLTQAYSCLSQIILGIPGTPWTQVFAQAAANPLLNLKVQPEDYASIDELEAEHYDLFGLTVYPYRNFFLDFEGKFGGEDSSDLIAFYQKHNFDHEKGMAGAGPTHLGTQLKFLSQLSPASDRKIFLEQFVFDWIFPFQYAVEDANNSVFSKVVLAVTDLLHAEYKTLSETQAESGFSLKLPPFTQIDEFLSNKDTSLNEISEFLLKPAYSGIYISRHLIKKMAADLNVPVGFGERRTIFSNLLQTASRFDNWGTFLSMLDGELSRWESRYQSIDESLSPIKQEWMAAVQRSKSLTEKLKSMSFEEQ